MIAPWDLILTPQQEADFTCAFLACENEYEKLQVFQQFGQMETYWLAKDAELERAIQKRDAQAAAFYKMVMPQPASTTGVTP